MTKKYARLEEVTWTDASGLSGWMEERNYLLDSIPSLCFSVGYVLKDEKQYITLVQSQSDHGETLDNSTTICKKMIVKRRRLG